jgi:hypothetical protein
MDHCNILCSQPSFSSNMKKENPGGARGSGHAKRASKAGTVIQAIMEERFWEPLGPGGGGGGGGDNPPPSTPMLYPGRAGSWGSEARGLGGSQGAPIKGSLLLGAPSGCAWGHLGPCGAPKYKGLTLPCFFGDRGARGIGPRWPPL